MNMTVDISSEGYFGQVIDQNVYHLTKIFHIWIEDIQLISLTSNFYLNLFDLTCIVISVS